MTLSGRGHWAHRMPLKNHILFFAALTFGDRNIAFVVAMRMSRNNILAGLDELLRLRRPDVVV